MLDENFFNRLGCPTQGAAPSGLNCHPDKFGADYPHIFAVLAQNLVGGKVRETGRLTIYSKPMEATVILTDKQTSHVVFYTSQTFTEALAGLEMALKDGTADWRKDNGPAYSTGKKRGWTGKPQ